MHLHSMVNQVDLLPVEVVQLEEGSVGVDHVGSVQPQGHSGALDESVQLAVVEPSQGQCGQTSGNEEPCDGKSEGGDFGGNSVPDCGDLSNLG